MRTVKIITTSEADLITGDVLKLPCTVNYYYINEENQAEEACVEIETHLREKDNWIAFDLETNSLSPFEGKVLLLQIGLSNNIQYIFDMRYLPIGKLKNILESNCWKIGQNLKFDGKFIKHHFNITLTNMYDTLLAEKVIRGGSYLEGGYSLDALINKRLGKELSIISGDFRRDLTGKVESAKKQMQRSFEGMGDKRKKFSEAQLAYAAWDTCAETIFELVKWQMKELKKEKLNTVYDLSIPFNNLNNSLIEKYERLNPKKVSLWNTALLEFRFLEVLIDLEHKGIRFDLERHKKIIDHLKYDYKEYRKDFLKRMSKHTKQDTLFGTASINPDSPKQALNALKEIGLEIEDTSAETVTALLKDLKKDTEVYKVVKCLAGYRKTAKIIQSFGDKLTRYVDEKTSRINFEVTQIVDTGRISNKNPNIQNQPSHIDWRDTGVKERDKERKEYTFRSCFVPEKGYKYVIYDYSAQELRVAASVTMDSLMLKAFKEDRDLHIFSTSLMYHEDYDNLIKLKEKGDKNVIAKRNKAKTVSFGVAYGGTAWGLAPKLGVSIDESKDIVSRYKSAFPEFTEAMLRYGKFALKHGYSNTVLGRRRYFTDLLDKIRWIRLETNPSVIDKKVRDFNMEWLVEEGPITYDNMEYAKSKLIGKYERTIIRKAGNHIVQGGSSDITKLAAVSIRKDIKDNNLDACIIAMIHDEIITEAREEDVSQCEKIVIKRMNEALNAFCPNVPSEVEGGVANYWKKF